MQAMPWMPEPPEGARICLGMDGSETGDWTAIKAETIDGLLFTPRWNGRPTIWNPAEHAGHRIPRPEVDAAVDYLFGHFEVERMYCDPPLWQTEIDTWASRYPDRVIPWATYRPVQMHACLERFVTDLSSGRLRHDGCPITSEHIRNSRMANRRDGRYILSKPDAARKIDAAVTSALAHEAASDARAAGWVNEPAKTRATFFRM